MSSYRERLWPSPWMYLATALVIPASILVFFPINAIAGYVVAGVLYAGTVALLLASAPLVAVEDGVLRAGKASIPLADVGTPSVHSGDDAQRERGPGLDARAWLLIRGWIDPVLRVPVTDPADPTPYWLISTRRPAELARAIESPDAKR